MDDGMQNPALAKDLTVPSWMAGVASATVASSRPGAARANGDADGADLIVVNGATGPVAPGGAIADLALRFPGRMLHATVAPAEDMRWLEARPVVAFAGIGNPRRFFDMLPRLGGTVAEAIAFRDHHPLSEADAMRVLTAARRHSATIVTTEKDLARLAGPGACGELRDASRQVPIRLVMPASGERDPWATCVGARDRKAPALTA
jgi:tetraacyldisaccharide 4'-kinase